ncbi:hypothetical protein GCM10023081_25760 [Arthrobacter ginkgonis]|uniref:Short-chain dehydrogenase n=2 Tax=Arthrobacter ginkgonis TaxID=1630594 RepID=A0ABP7CFX9_9MICC
MKIVLADADKPRVDALVAELRAQGAEAIGVPANLTKPGEAQRLLEATVSAYGAAHVLCNNASVLTGSLQMDMWHWIADVDLGTTIAICRAFLPLLAAQEEAHIVNTCAAPGLTGLPAASPSLRDVHAAMRSGVWGMSQNLSDELGRGHPNIGVSLLVPEFTRTDAAHFARAMAGDPTQAGLIAQAGLMAKAPGRTPLPRAAVGRDPLAMAGLVCDAVRKRRFYVLPHQQKFAQLLDIHLRRRMDVNAAPVRAPRH